MGRGSAHSRATLHLDYLCRQCEELRWQRELKDAGRDRCVNRNPGLQMKTQLTKCTSQRLELLLRDMRGISRKKIRRRIV